MLLTADRDRADLGRATGRRERGTQRRPPFARVRFPRAAGAGHRVRRVALRDVLPLSGSTMTTLVAWVELSTPATSVPIGIEPPGHALPPVASTPGPVREDCDRT